MTGPTAQMNETRGSGNASRRTQQQRREETRAKLREATYLSLLNDGYVATSTRRVAELAGVSTGALSHHFPTRVELVGAAIEELAERRIVELKDRASALPPGPERRVGLLLDLIWADFSSGLFAVFVKVWVAAAEDPELHERLVPVERGLARRIGAEVDEIVGNLTIETNWERHFRAVLNAMRGLALKQGFEPRAVPSRDPWPDLRESLLDLLLAPARTVGKRPEE